MYAQIKYSMFTRIYFGLLGVSALQLVGATVVSAVGQCCLILNQWTRISQPAPTPMLRLVFIVLSALSAPDDAPVMAGGAFAARLPTVHPFAEFGILVVEDRLGWLK